MAAPTHADPHRVQPVLTGGPPLDQARAVLLMLHGRGGSPQDMLALAAEIGCAECAVLAPQAAGFTWYPHPFLAPLESNQPWLDSALARIDTLLAELEQAGQPAERVALLGFSQGACLALEYAARHPRRFGAVIGLSGGLIGPPGPPRQTHGRLDGTPVFLGCSAVDPHIPRERVAESARVLAGMGGQVDQRIYPGLGHAVNQDELAAVQAILGELVKPKEQHV